MAYLTDDYEGVMPVDFFMENNEGVDTEYEEYDEITGEFIDTVYAIPDGDEVLRRPRRR